MTRAEAKALGLTRYTTGKPCRNGHIAERMTSCGTCCACRKPQKAKHYDKHPKRKWAESVVAGARYRMRQIGKGDQCTITASYIHSITPDVCPIFGTVFVFKGNKVSSESATLDRLVPELGYVPGNIAVISMKANRIKNAYGSEDVLKVGEWLKSRGL
jgi:hypothetical protein